MSNSEANSKTNHSVVSRDEWEVQRKSLLTREKELMKLKDEIAKQRRELPWVEVDKNYLFDTSSGQKSLSDLFEGRHQLIVQYFMFAPNTAEGCSLCAFMADHTDSAIPHLAQRDVSFVAVSRASASDIDRLSKRLGWKFNWVSSQNNDFNRDFGVFFTKEEIEKGEIYYNYAYSKAFPFPDATGICVFYKDDDGRVYHTYSTYGRGVELMMHTYNFLDITPLGRNEKGLSYPMAWVRYHDRYDAVEPDLKRQCCESNE